ncbi:MAG: toxin [SAR324 cluster bacterium]|nr:toxin [SAR324 cluster bacterium]
MKKIQWNPEKSETIQNNSNRGVSLELIAELIQNDAYVDIITRTNYPDQGAFVLPIDEEVWCVPFREEDETIYLITAWPDRKLRRKYQ